MIAVDAPTHFADPTRSAVFTQFPKHVAIIFESPASGAVANQPPTYVYVYEAARAHSLQPTSTTHARITSLLHRTTPTKRAKMRMPNGTNTSVGAASNFETTTTASCLFGFYE